MLLLFLMINNIFVLTKVNNIQTIMSSQTFALIRNLSYQLPDPPRADRAMHQLLCVNLKLTRKVLTKNLIRMIIKKDIGTNEVENFVRNMKNCVPPEGWPIVDNFIFSARSSFCILMYCCFFSVFRSAFTHQPPVKSLPGRQSHHCVLL